MNLRYLGILIVIIISVYLLIGITSAVSGNGNFETGALYPWDYVDNSGDYIYNNNIITPAASHTGNYGAELASVSGDDIYLAQVYPTTYLLNHNVTFWYKINHSSGSNGIYIDLYLDYVYSVTVVDDMSCVEGDWIKVDKSIDDILDMPENQPNTWADYRQNSSFLGGWTQLVIQQYSNSNSNMSVYYDDLIIPDETHKFTGGGFESPDDVGHFTNAWQHWWQSHPKGQEIRVSNNEAHSGNSSALFNATLYVVGDDHYYQDAYIELVQELPSDWEYISFWYKIPEPAPTQNRIDVEVVSGSGGEWGNDILMQGFETWSPVTTGEWTHVYVSRADALAYGGYTEADLASTSNYKSLYIEFHGRNMGSTPTPVEYYLDDVSIGVESNFTHNETGYTSSFTDTSLGFPTGWSWFFGDENYTQSWVQQNASPGWEKRNSPSAAALPNGHIVLMGGRTITGNIYYNDTWITTNNGVTWTEQNHNSEWTKLIRSSVVATSTGDIILIGGYDYNGPGYNWKNDVWKSTNEGITWTLQNASTGWAERDGAVAVILPNGHIIITGGAEAQYYRYNDTWRSVDEGVTWQLMNASSGWKGRWASQMVALPDSSIVIMGGMDIDGYSLNDTWRSIDEGQTWVIQKVSAAWYTRDSFIASSTPSGSILIASGEDSDSGNTLEDVWVSHDKGITWTNITVTNVVTPRYDAVMVSSSDGSLVALGGTNYPTEYNDTWRLDIAGSHNQNPAHTYTTGGLYNVTLQVYNALDYNRTQKQITVPSGSHLLSLTFEDSTNFTVIQNVTITDNHGASFTAVDGTFNHTYTGEVALLIHAEGYNDLTVQYSMSEDYTGIVLLEPAMAVTNIHQTTYFPHLVRISCMNYLGTPIQDMSVTAVVVESTSPYSWLADIFGINTNQTEIVNTTLKGTTDSEGGIAFMMVENLKYKLDFSKPSFRRITYIQKKVIMHMCSGRKDPHQFQEV
jgi:hypothetical protein